MRRNVILLAALVAVTTLASGGCQSCSSCHDYDPPVAGCNCDACGTHRSGSVSDGCGGCSTGGCNCGQHGGYVDPGYESGYSVDDSYSTGPMTDGQSSQNAGR